MRSSRPLGNTSTCVTIGLCRVVVDAGDMRDATFRDSRSLVQRCGLADRPEDGLARCERSARKRAHAGRGGFGAFRSLCAVGISACLPLPDDQRVRGRSFEDVDVGLRSRARTGIVCGPVSARRYWRGLCRPCSACRQHGSATLGCAAVAGVPLPELTGVPSLDEERVVDAQLFAGQYRPHGANEYPAITVLGFAVRAARMVDPPGTVAADCAIDDSTVADVEVEGVLRVFRIARMTEYGVIP